MTISVGDKLPDATFKIMTAEGPTDITTAELFDGKRVAMFAVPGAYTPTCHRNHLPGFLENYDTILAKGIDSVICVSVNDAFVMDAWGNDTGANGKIIMLADGSALFTKAIGLELDATAGGMGVRSQRYSMIVNDGTVETLNVEEAAGQATTSGAAVLLEQL